MILITGTHHTPAIELIEQLKKDPKTSWQIEYVGHIYPTETHILGTIIPKLKVNFHPLEAGKFDRHYPFNTIKGLPKTVLSVIRAYRLIHKIKPDIVVSFGGYISVPVIFASFLHKIPSITHEQTLTTSLSTKLNSLFVDKVALSFENSSQTYPLPKVKTIITGNLLRREIFNNSTKNFSKVRKPFIYITGGNQSSNYINNLIFKTLPQLTKKFTIIHQIGNITKTHQITSNYFPIKYVGPEDIGWILNNCTLIISRSGANISQEIVALEKKSILIPLPSTQQNEQFKNALWVKEKLPQQTIVIPQENLNKKSLLTAIQKLNSLSVNKKNIHLKPNYKLIKLIYELL